MTRDSKEGGYALDHESKSRVSKAIGLGMVTAASAIAGGLAVAWWYRKTLTKLQNPIAPVDIQNSGFAETEDGSLPNRSPELNHLEASD